MGASVSEHLQVGEEAKSVVERQTLHNLDDIESLIN